MGAGADADADAEVDYEAVADGLFAEAEAQKVASLGPLYQDLLEESDSDVAGDFDADAAAAAVKPSEVGKWVWGFPDSDVPELPSSKVVHDAKSVFKAGVDYLGAAARHAHLESINSNCPEVAVVGRSNVGKSSLLNALVNIKSQNKKEGAIVSRKPGRTRTMHAFGVGFNAGWQHRSSLPDFRAVIVDLPGYGFAKTNVKHAQSMAKVVRSYLTERDRRLLAHVLVLVDARVGLTEHDMHMVQMLNECLLPFSVVLTKCDRLSEAGLDKSVLGVTEALAIPGNLYMHARLIGVSAQRKPLKGSALKYPNVTHGNIQRLRAEILMHADAHLFHRLKTSSRIAAARPTAKNRRRR